MSENSLKVWKQAGIAGVVVAIMASLLFGVKDRYQIFWLFAIFGLAIIRPLPIKQWTKIDYCLCIITVYDCVSCFYADCRMSAIHTFILSVFCLTVYLLLRRLFSCERATKIIMFGSYFSIVVALLLAICSFFIFRKSVLNAGFQDTYHFRFLFSPLGYNTNRWAEVLLIILGWIFLIRQYSAVFIFLSVFAILLSFSRGAYIALGVYIISWLLFVKPIREKQKFPVIALIAIILVGIFFQKEMQTTLQMNRTTSQKQSTEWRISSTQTSIDIFKKKPIFGYGNGNYSYATDCVQHQDSTLAYTNNAPNIIVQILIEKGFIGALLYLFLAIAVCFTIWKGRQQTDKCIIFCILLALFMRELTQATLLGSSFILFMFYVILAYLQRTEKQAEESECISMQNYLIISVLFVCYFSWVCIVFYLNRNMSYQKDALSAIEKGDYAAAVKIMDKSWNNAASNVNRALLYMNIYKKTNDANYLNKAEESLQKSYEQQPEDIQLRYLTARIYIDKKNYDEALKIIQTLTSNYPKNSLYHIALFDILYEQNEKEIAMQHLIDAIRYTPRLLTNYRIKDLQQNDSIYYDTLKQKLSILEPTSPNNPADYARCGYILKWCGNEQQAIEYLQVATEKLPNLATPWHLLGDDKKYQLLSYGAFSKNLLSKNIPEEKEMTDESLFASSYKYKFENWYGAELFNIEP